MTTDDMKIKIQELLNECPERKERLVNGKYVMQDEVLYRITGFGELKTILDFYKKYNCVIFALRISPPYL